MIALEALESPVKWTKRR